MRSLLADLIFRSPVAEIGIADGDVAFDGQRDRRKARAGQRDLRARNQIGQDEDEHVVPVARAQLRKAEAGDAQDDVEEVVEGQGDEEDVEGAQSLLPGEEHDGQPVDQEADDADDSDADALDVEGKVDGAPEARVVGLAG